MHGGRLFLFAMLLPCAVRAAEHLDPAVVQLCGGIHVLEQFQVVADDDESASPVVDHLRETCACGPVEVVRRLVEQGDRGTPDSEAGDRDQHRLSAGEGVDSAVEIHCGEADLVEGLLGTCLDVPVVAHGVEVARIGVSGFDGPERCDDPVDTQEFGDGRVLAGGQRLGQIPHLPDRVDASRRGPQQPGDQSEQCGLTRSVPPDETGAPGGEGAAHAIERDGAVGPFEGEVSQSDCGGTHALPSLS